MKIKSPTYVIESDNSDSDCEIIDKHPELIILDEDKDTSFSSDTEEMKTNVGDLFYEDRTPANGATAKVESPPDYNLRIKVVVGSKDLTSGVLRSVQKPSTPYVQSRGDKPTALTKLNESISNVSDFLSCTTIQPLSENVVTSTTLPSRQVTNKTSDSNNTIAISIANNGPNLPDNCRSVTHLPNTSNGESHASIDQENTLASSPLQKTIINDLQQVKTTKTTNKSDAVTAVSASPDMVVDDSVIFVSETQYERNNQPIFRPFGSNFIRLPNVQEMGNVS